MDASPLRYRRTTLKADGTTHVEELEMDRDDYRLRGSLVSFYQLINNWNAVSARGFRRGYNIYLYTVVSD